MIVVCCPPLSVVLPLNELRSGACCMALITFSRYALLMQRDDLVGIDATLQSGRVNVIDDHRFANAIASHLQYVGNGYTGSRDDGRPRWHRAVGVVAVVVAIGMLMIVRRWRPLLLLLVAALALIVAMSQQATGDGADGATDQRTFRNFIVLLADDPADHRTAHATEDCAVPRSLGLLRPLRWTEPRSLSPCQPKTSVSFSRTRK